MVAHASIHLHPRPRFRALTLAAALGLGSSTFAGCTFPNSPTAVAEQHASDLECRWDDAGKAQSSPSSPPATQNGSPPSAGQMTEEAALAKRLFDNERWLDAGHALARVADGTTGDDLGNRQIAQYLLGIALHRQGRFDEAANIFVGIAADPKHLKHPETELWLSKLLTEPAVSLRALDALYAYPDEVTARFDNGQQRDIYQLLTYATARSALRHGDATTAAARFRKVTKDSPYAGFAEGCLRFVGPASAGPTVAR